MSHSSSPQVRRGYIAFGILLGLLIMVAVAYNAIRFFIDQNNYNKGHQAYLQTDCTVAIRHFDSVINAWQLVDIGGFPGMSAREKAECIPFQAAVNQHQAGDFSGALIAYKNFIKEYNNSVLTEPARSRGASLFVQAKPSELADELSCSSVDSLREENLIPQPDVNLPPFYLSCGQFYDSANNQQDSFEMYKKLLTEYPNALLAEQAEASLMASPLACEKFDLLKNSVIAERSDFMPSLYYQCGQVYEGKGNWDQAISMYETFLANYPDHVHATDAEAGLARSIVSKSQATSAGEIPAPERSGSTGSEVTEVVIQNDSPEHMRIVFSGPESRVEELEPCTSCTTYSGEGPLYCPELGPVGRYSLPPGAYDIVVESISDTGTTPWTGNWSLVTGDEYYSCFVIIITFEP